MPTSLHELFGEEIESFDQELRRFLEQRDDPQGHYGMVRYQLGFADEHFQSTVGPRQERGKRVRPLLCTLIGRATGVRGDVTRTLMIAAELLHSASLVHDDIEDSEPLRWGRPTLWSVVGIPQAINVGDALVGLSFEALLRLREQGVSSELAYGVIARFVRAYSRMTEGQYLDLSFQGRLELGVDAYLDLIARKTGAALECFAGATSSLAESGEAVERAYGRFGAAFGVLYQIADDIRGIWGELEETGKYASRDIVLRKLTLPLLVGAKEGSPKLRERLLVSREAKPTFTSEEAREISAELLSSGVDKVCAEIAMRYRDEALGALEATEMRSNERALLEAMVRKCATGLPAALA